MSARKHIKLAVFDVCDTLYYSNTTHDFVRYVLGRRNSNSVTRYLHKTVNAKYSPLLYFLIIVGVGTGWDAAKSINLRLLKGMTEDKLNSLAVDFVSEYLGDRRINKTFELVGQARSDGLAVVLASSSIEPVVAAVSRDVGADGYLSTTLEYENGFFTGRIADEILGRKLDILRMRFENADLAYAVSDNVSDKELLSSAKDSIAVTHHDSKRKFWQRLGIEILDVGK